MTVLKQERRGLPGSEGSLYCSGRGEMRLCVTDLVGDMQDQLTDGRGSWSGDGDQLDHKQTFRGEAWTGG